MIKAGDILSSRETGETFTFLQTAADTGGRLLRLEMRAAPNGGAKAVPLHFHPKQEERFFIHEGRICFLIDGKTQRYEAGEAVVVPPGTPHTWYNPGPAEARFTVELEPALQTERFFESLCTLSRDGLLPRSGRINPFRLAVCLHAYPDHLYLTGLPVGLQKRLFAAMAFAGRRLGFPDYYPYFPAPSETPELLPQP